ncbi:aldo/keto reductase [Pararobbsia alpina]|uniref:Oxidoreductase YdhF n=1 Tax=Pararobbsia alpina TaxID=621374 RepID=A0A6S7CLS1_9BURK|nr:aldo/keto reductase [Pararobbsia alpina]CAB3783075.1 Oxidoreductase YdhF [Pararobbsia alpina]
MHCPRIEIAPQGPILSCVTAGMWRLGEWQMNPAQRLDYIERSIERGVTSFDHADIYGGYTVEALFGEAIALKPSVRQQIELVGKCGIALPGPNRPSHTLKHYDTSTQHIVASVEQSLQSLRTDRLDMLLIHRPDPLLDLDEVAEAFQRLRREGKVLHFGVSNFTPWQYQALSTSVRLVTNQVEFSPLRLDPLTDGTFDQLQSLGTSPMIWSALGGGRLFGPDCETATRVRAAVDTLAGTLGVSAATVVYAWIFRLPSKPVVLTGSQRLGVLDEAIAATGLKLTTQQWFAIYEACLGHEVP